MLKHSVKLLGIKPELVVGLMACQQVYQLYGVQLVITSACDGTHSRNSLHYAGQAADLRIKHMSKGTAEKIARKIQDAIGSNFDVILESNHIHVEYQPHREIY